MPIYHLALKSGWNAPAIDRDGEDLANDDAAYGYALKIGKEIMRNCEARCRSYRLEIYNENLENRGEVLFASIDETLAHLPKDHRNLIIEIARASASLNDTIGELSRTLRSVRETLNGTEAI